jgi:hypothetical protein
MRAALGVLGRIALAGSICLAVPALTVANDVPLGPFNTDPLSQRGISPRVLDIAVSMLHQGPGFVMLFEFEETVGDAAPWGDRGRVNFDPFTDYGLELNFELEEDHNVSARQYRRALQRTLDTEFWLRQEDRLHDPGSFEVLSESGDDAVVAFRYNRRRLPAALSWIRRLEGKVYIEDGRLDRVELTNTRPMSYSGAQLESLRRTVYFGRVLSGEDGYLIDQMVLEGEGRRGRQAYSFVQREEVVSYFGEGGRPIEWEQREQQVEDSELTVPVRLRLQRKLPLMANDVRKLGFNLPKTYGVGLIGNSREFTFDIDKLEFAGIDLSDPMGLALIDPVGTQVDVDSLAYLVRADMWVLPFLNVSVLAGEYDVDSDVTIRLTPLGQIAAEAIFGVPTGQFLRLAVEEEGEILGVGLVTGAQYQNLFTSISVQYVETLNFNSGSKYETWTFPVVFGYDFGASGFRLLTSAILSRGNRRIEGIVEGTVPFAVEGDMNTNTYTLGFRKEWRSTWALTGFYGDGDTTDVNLFLEYRW